MSDLLFLVHRLPYPPDKGDKVRSYHLLRHLTQRHRVHLATFIDDPDDWRHVAALKALCASLHVSALHPRRARVASLLNLLGGDPLTLRYYRDESLARWVRDRCEQTAMDHTLVFSSAMAQYVPDVGAGRLLLDLVDVDSAKWTEYAQAHRWPMSWLYGREGRTLLAYERQAAARAEYTFLATDKEAELFRGLAPEVAHKVGAFGNGVDAQYFQPQADRTSPFAAGEQALVFTGAMDYWPNIDAVRWFVAEMLPALRRQRPGLRFHIVGRNPGPTVRELAGEAVSVSGTVPDVRPYLQHAAAVVAPLRLARGIQNKVLEAMAMARPVVASASCVSAIDAQPGHDLLGAEEAPAYVAHIEALLAEPARAQALGQAGRACVLRSYDWTARLRGLDQHLALAGTPA